MHKHVFISFFLLICIPAFSQWQNEKVDLGELTENSKRFVDFKIHNPTKNKIYILRVNHNPETSYRLSSDLILPDSSIVLRTQVNPKKKGEFNYTFSVHLSNLSTPIEYTVTGNLISILSTNNSLTQCPDFNQSPINYANQEKKITIITVDKETGEKLGNSTVSIIHNGIPAGTWITGTSGAFKDKFPPGYFYFLVSHTNYLNKEDGIYVSPEISEITIPLIRSTPRTAIPELATQIPTDDGAKLTDKVAKNELEKQLEKEIDTTQNTPLPELASVPADNFSTEYFKNLNVIFVLDVSSSMKMTGKMDLLKYSLNQLVSKLRTDDIMGIVTYANTAQVFQAPVKGYEKEVLATAVSSLKPLGMTAGGKGIKLGYKQVLKNYSVDKANLVIIITDGAFNRDSDDYQKTVKKYAKKGITCSVVGILAKEKDAELMDEAAKFGKGRYIPIQKLADAHTGLVNEIRISTFKKK